MLQSEFGGRPDLIIGNYSDGNLVATMLSDKMGVIQCTIAHALEKTKYLYSDLYWDNMEQDYNFSIQFTADLLAMNKTDFIVTNSLQEIIGSESTMGQYEAYQFFSMPGLYRVKGGINLLSPKFNVIPPGVDERIYFSYNEHEHRIQHTSDCWKQRLFHNSEPDIFGHLDHPGRPAIFSMARLDRIKNLTGLVEAYGQSTALQKHFNLIIAAGTIDAARSHDDEEKHEIARMYDLINHYRLAGKIRWLPSIQKLDTGEVYRLIADGKGIFVQPALFEAFGLTVIEAMVSGLPTFGPKFGGPSEIIEDNYSGFLLNTSRPDLIAQGLESFVEKLEHNPELWEFVSDNGIKRVQEHFNWRNYSSRLINLTKLYGFWRYSSPERERGKLDRYSDTLFHFLIRERAARL